MLDEFINAAEEKGIPKVNPDFTIRLFAILKGKNLGCAAKVNSRASSTAFAIISSVISSKKVPFSRTSSIVLFLTANCLSKEPIKAPRLNIDS